MNCPVCDKPMLETDFGGVAVDICQDGCNGLWFDYAELAKVEGENTSLSAAIQSALDSAGATREDRGAIRCPRCQVALHTHIHRGTRGVSIDECYTCGGFFLDAGELKAIRENRMTRQEVDQATQGMLICMPDYVDAQTRLLHERVRAAAVRSLWRGVLPINYRIP